MFFSETATKFKIGTSNTSRKVIFWPRGSDVPGKRSCTC